MNQLTKDQVKKLGLSIVGFFVLLYVYFSFFLGPLNNGRETAQSTINDLQNKLASSEKEIAKAASLEKQASASTARFTALKALNPEGAPIAWFPPRMKLFFANQQIDKASIRLEGNSPYKEPEMAAWNKFTWLIDLPQTEFSVVGKALAELENSEPLLTIPKLNIRAAADNPQFQQFTITANTVIMKR